MLWLAASLALAPGLGSPVQTKADHMQWWREARFGMFIHWGLYAVPAGVWQGKNYPGASEWLMNTAKITPAEYAPLREKFNPVNFDARQWVRTAKAAGMKYIVITSKHHDGFALWHTKQTDWSIEYTPFKRDVLKELAVAAKAEGIRLCFYHSIMDWTHPDYLPRREWDKRDASKASFDRYVKFMKAQLKELLSGDYGDIGILWFDGEWEGTWTHERGADLYKFVRSLDKDIIINNRVDKGRSGMAGLTQGDAYGDYGTPEQEIPANGIPGVDWEWCMTINNSWGFHQNDHDWKSTRTLLQNLIDCASKGGNYLLNVGPNALGEIPTPSVERLLGVGQWLAKNGESIYGSHAGPFTKPLGWGRVTQKPGRLYLHVFNRGTGQIELPGLQTQIVRVHPLGSENNLRVNKTADGYRIELPEMRAQPESIANQPLNLVHTFVVEVTGPVKVEKIPIKPDAAGVVTLAAEEASVTGHAAYEGGDKRAIGYWTNQKDTVSWDFEAPAGTYTVNLEYAADPAMAGATFQVDVDGSRIQGTADSTGGWANFKTITVGKLALRTTGKHKVTISALKMPNGAVMNLRGITLTKAPGARASARIWARDFSRE
jgi:alpha-L-fucosidase